MLNQSVKSGVHPTTFAQIFTKNARLPLCLSAQYWVEAARREQKLIAQEHGGKLSLGGQGTIPHCYQTRSGSLEMSFRN